MDKHFDRVVEAAEIQKLPEDNKMDYFKAMISDKERLEYGEDRYNVGKAEGKAESARIMISAGFQKEEVLRLLDLKEEDLEKNLPLW